MLFASLLIRIKATGAFKDLDRMITGATDLSAVCDCGIS